MQEIQQLLAITSALKEKYKHYNKSFTLDGKLVGDIGEVLVAEQYGLTLYGDNTPVHDGFVTGDENKKVQIKASFNKYFYFSKDLKNMPQYFIAIQLKEDGTFEEVYNGLGVLIYDKMLRHLSNERKHNYRLSVKKLLELNDDPENDKIKRING
ncbi:hypothetical protein [Flavobacterium sp.]|uniref:DUF6998 domain-containing protein n=1 Tax=Flavobacterium sp. TaxID=239 RepID=UPI0035B1397F